MGISGAKRALRKGTGMAEKESDKDILNSLVKGLEVIVVMGKHDSLSMTELANITGMNRYLVRRIILTLESLGYVGREGRSLRLLPKVLDLGHAFMYSMDLWKIADPLIVELVDAVQLSCTMSLLEGRDIVYIARRMSSRVSVSLPLQVGSRVPAHCTASGRVLLSGMADEDLDAWLNAEPLGKLTMMTETDPAKLRERIAQSRYDGWCRVDHELAIGNCSVAFPVRDRSGRIIAAISLSGKEEDLASPSIPDDLRAVTYRIESVLHRR